MGLKALHCGPLPLPLEPLPQQFTNASATKKRCCWHWLNWRKPGSQKGPSSAPTIEESYRRFLKFADQHPHEYRLLWGPAWSELLGPGRPRPIKEWLLEKFAVRFGGKPKDYALNYYALFLLVHGTASLLIVTRDRRTKKEMVDSCLAICDALVANMEVLRRK